MIHFHIKMYKKTTNVLDFVMLFPTMFKTRKICNCIQDNSSFHLVAHQWHMKRTTPHLLAITYG